MNQIFRETITTVDSPYFAVSTTSTPSEYPEHWHTSAEVILAKKDHCVFSVSGETYELNQDEIIIVWPTELHSTINSPCDGYSVVQFDSSLITNCKDFNVYYHSLRNIHKLIDISEELNHYVCQKIKDIQKLRTECFSEPKILICIYEMMIWICKYVHTNHIEDKNNFSTSDPTFYVIKKACSYIDANCDRNLTQAEVAEHCGFSSYYFSKLFHKYTSETFPEYLTKRRIGVSTLLLQNKSLSIAEVSYLSGFQSISNFNKLFKKSKGCTPLQYRKLYSEENYTTPED